MLAVGAAGGCLDILFFPLSFLFSFFPLSLARYGLKYCLKGPLRPKQPICHKRDFMLSLSEVSHSDVISTFNSISRYLDDLLNIDNNFFDNMVNRIYPSKHQLNKANVSDTEASFLDLH